MRQASGEMTVTTGSPGLHGIGAQVARWVSAQGIREGLFTIFCQHTSASLLIQENAAPAVREDLHRFFAALAPHDPHRYAHDDEGPDDMPAHIRAALTQVQLSIPVRDGRLVLGTWQTIYLFEHRDRPHRRTLALHLIGQ